jgi:hypothetical protein
MLTETMVERESFIPLQALLAGILQNKERAVRKVCLLIFRAAFLLAQLRLVE